MQRILTRIRTGALFLLSAAGLLSACSPPLNWREVQLETGMRGLLPCKPDQTQQAQTLAGRTIQIQMQGCEAGDALWALASADLGTGANAIYPEIQQAWQVGLQKALQSDTAASAQPYKVVADPGEPGVAVSLAGRSPEGKPLQVRALWFLRGQRIHLAVVYAQRITPDMLETFWDSVRSQ
jgi:hypothetical protein